MRIIEEKEGGSFPSFLFVHEVTIIVLKNTVKESFKQEKTKSKTKSKYKGKVQAKATHEDPHKHFANFFKK